MGRSLDEIIQGLPSARRHRIESLAEQKVQEMLAAAKTLADIRKAVGKTQANVAQELGIQQNAVSQLERRSDTYLSTLRRFLKSLGLELELSVISESGARHSLDNFHPWIDDADSAAETVPTHATKSRSNTEREQRAATAPRHRAVTSVNSASRKMVAPPREATAPPARKKVPSKKRAA